MKTPRFSLLAAASVLGLFTGILPAQNATPDERARAMLARMTTEEKIGQIQQIHGPDEAAASEGRVGSFLNIVDPAISMKLQREAVEQSRLGIPLLLGRDVIHGFRTVFPIPLGTACTWDDDLAREGARAAAAEAAVGGYNWTFSPMVDISRDARWGRIAESFGEDPYLSARMAAAFVEGYQSPMPGRPKGIAACIKHFGGYGAAEAGRDYGSTPIPPRELNDVYLKPYEGGVKAGALTVMSAFNELDGVPCTGSHFLLTEVLRQRWGFEGMVVSDWESVVELTTHGFAKDHREAAMRAINAGLDMEMTSHSYRDYMADLLASGEVSMATLDERVLAILRVKYALGLFEDPYGPAFDAKKYLLPETLALAQRTAEEGAVLLKNEGDLLPLGKGVTVAVVGPLADAAHEQLGTWAPDGRDADAVTPLAALREKLGADRVIYAPGLTYSRDASTGGFAAAVAAAKKADVVLCFAGEESLLSGEAHSRADITLPGEQEALVQALAATGKPVVLVLMTGRPVAIENLRGKVPAILAAFHGGTMAGPALANLLFGDASPSGRLTVSWPMASGQEPIYYNHKSSGRPASYGDFVPIEKIPQGQLQTSLGFKNSHIDLPPWPAWPFGFGLTYGKIGYSDLELSAKKIGMNGVLTVSATVTNSGARAATEVVQLYVRDDYGCVTRPVRELKGYERVSLAPGESKKVSFTLRPEDLSFTHIDMAMGPEKGTFTVWIAPDSASGLEGHFSLE
jgi:beta-glucosidase